MGVRGVGGGRLRLYPKVGRMPHFNVNEGVWFHRRGLVGATPVHAFICPCIVSLGGLIRRMMSVDRPSTTAHICPGLPYTNPVRLLPRSCHIRTLMLIVILRHT